MAEWLDPDNLEDAEHTTQDLLNELASEPDEIAGQVEFWPVGVEVGNVRNLGSRLISGIERSQKQFVKSARVRIICLQAGMKVLDKKQRL
jgi:hypothetical protein